MITIEIVSLLPLHINFYMHKVLQFLKVIRFCRNNKKTVKSIFIQPLYEHNLSDLLKFTEENVTATRL